MPNVVSPCEILCDARTLIDKKGWTQHQEYDTLTGAYCLKGACDSVLREKVDSHAERSLMTDLVLLHLTAAINNGKPTESWTTVTGFNDKKSRSKEEVLNILDIAGSCK